MAFACYLQSQRALPIDEDEFAKGMSLDRPEEEIAFNISRLAEANRTILALRIANDDARVDPTDPRFWSHLRTFTKRCRKEYPLHRSELRAPRVLALANDAVLAELLLALGDRQLGMAGMDGNQQGLGCARRLCMARNDRHARRRSSDLNAFGGAGTSC